MPLADGQVQRVVRLGVELGRPGADAARDEASAEDVACARVERAAVGRLGELALPEGGRPGLIAVVVVAAAAGDKASHYRIHKYVIAYAGPCHPEMVHSVFG
jgi:hypothetical protein